MDTQYSDYFSCSDEDKLKFDELIKKAKDANDIQTAEQQAIREQNFWKSTRCIFHNTPGIENLKIPNIVQQPMQKYKKEETKD